MSKKNDLPKLQPIRMGKTPGRNEKCPCNSDRKYKYCHGMIVKQAVQKSPYQPITALYSDEQQEAVQNYINRFGHNPDAAGLELFTACDYVALIESIATDLEDGGATRTAAALRRCGFLITPLNRDKYTAEAIIAWEKVRDEYECPVKPPC